MSSLFIPVQQAVATNLVAPNPPKEPQKLPPGASAYTRTYFQYNYGTAEKPFLSDPLFELQKTKASIKKKVKDGKVTWKLNLILRDENDINGCKQLDVGVRNAVAKYKGQFKQFSFTVENPGNLNGVFFYSRTPEGQIIEGTSPMMSFKMDPDKTTFAKLIPHFDASGALVIDQVTGQPKYSEELLDYKTLENTSFECGLVFCLRDLYHTGSAMPLPQLFVRTCWILSNPSQKGSVDFKQSSVLANFLKDAKPEDLDTLAALIDKLKADKGSLLETAGSKPGQLALPAPPSTSASQSPPAPSQGYPQGPPAPSQGYPQSYPPQSNPAASQGYPQSYPPQTPPQARPVQVPGLPQQGSGAPSVAQAPGPSIDLTAYMNPPQASPGFQGGPPIDLNGYLQSGGQVQMNRI